MIVSYSKLQQIEHGDKIMCAGGSSGLFWVGIMSQLSGIYCNAVSRLWQPLFLQAGEADRSRTA